MLITCNFLGGRLAETMYMIYGLFYFCIQNKIPIDRIKINKGYIGRDFNNKDKYNVYNYNQPIFRNIDKIFISEEKWKKLFNNAIIIDNKMEIYGKYFNFNNDQNYILTNYWHKPLIKKLFNSMFKPKNEIIKLQKEYKNINFNNTCSIHIRLGDFIKIRDNINHYSKYFSNKKPIEFNQIYNQVINFKKYNPDMIFFVFSDDIDYCKQNLKLNNCIWSKENPPWKDLLLISLCKYHIINEGSFFSYIGEILSD